MTNTEILYNAGGCEHVDTVKVEGYCKICGKQITEGVKEKEVLSGNFTNFSDCKRIDSNYVCKECAWAMKNADLRKNNFVADSKHLYLLKKNDLEEYLFNLEKYVEGDFVVGITTSFKKHNSFRCKVNSNPKRYYIRQEDKEYIFDAEKLKPVYEKLNEAYLQFSKEELQSGQYKMISIEQFGLEKFQEYEAIFKQYRGSAQFDLLIYMMNSEKRNEYMQAKIQAEKEEKARQKEIEKKKKEEEKKCGKKKQNTKSQEKILEAQQLQLF